VVLTMEGRGEVPDGPSPAAGLQPAHTYDTRNGYQKHEDLAYELSNGHGPTTATEQPTDSLEEDDDGEDHDDLFDDSDEQFSDNEINTSNPADYTKSYNRQRRLNDPSIPASQKPKVNSEGHAVTAGAKPTANTRANVDDQVQSLSRHAAKLRLTDLESGLGS